MKESPSRGPRRPKLPQRGMETDSSPEAEEPIADATDGVPVPTPGRPKPRRANQLSDEREEPLVDHAADTEAFPAKLSRRADIQPKLVKPDGRASCPNATPPRGAKFNGGKGQAPKSVEGANQILESGGVVEFVEDCPNGAGLPDCNSTNSTNSTAVQPLESVVLPTGSLFADYLVYAQAQIESADSYIVGSVLSIVAAVLARHVYFEWGDEKIYPNLFVMLAGRSGDRKSTAINLAESVAKAVLSPECFLPHNCSAESLFDEYCAEAGGSPDKILVADDANPILGSWTKSGYGERVGQRFLNLYDCKSLSESFERNKRKETDAGRRSIPETSTSVLLGGTFDICRLDGKGISSGLQRRFLFYAAERHGRFLACPPPSDKNEFDRLVGMLLKLSGIIAVCRFSGGAKTRWEQFQQRNRELLHEEKSDAHAARLNGAPRQVQKVAMLFEASLWTKRDEPVWDGIIHPATLELAIAHVEHCLHTAARLDSIADRANITSSADTLLARIRRDFGSWGHVIEGWIRLTKTEITAKYAHHSKRSGSWKPDDLYDRLIPNLIERRLARLGGRQGKKVWYDFLPEE